MSETAETLRRRLQLDQQLLQFVEDSLTLMRQMEDVVNGARGILKDQASARIFESINDLVVFVRHNSDDLSAKVSDDLTAQKRKVDEAGL